MKAGELLAPNQFSQTLSSPSNLPVNSLIDQINASSELSNKTRVAVEEKGKKLADYCLAKELVGEHLKSIDKQEDRQRQVSIKLGMILSNCLQVSCVG